MNPDAELSTALADRTRFTTLEHRAECKSTQALAMELEGPAVCWADHQTAGRGRQGRPWLDDAGRDLAVTFRVPDLALPFPVRLSALVPAVAARAVASATGLRPAIKWPNDLLLGGYKLCGVLIDALGRPDTWLIGIGLNVNRTDFPADLRDGATSLALVSGREWDRRALLLELAVTLDAGLEDLVAGRTAGWAEAFRNGLGLMGRRVVAETSESAQSGVLTGLDLDVAVLDDSRRIPLATLHHLAPA